MNRKRTVIVSLAVALVILAGGAACFIYFRSTRGGAGGSSSGGTFQTYENKDLGITFEYPAEWQAVVDYDTVTSSSLSGDPGQYPTSSVMVALMPPDGGGADLAAILQIAGTRNITFFPGVSAGQSVAGQLAAICAYTKLDPCSVKENGNGLSYVEYGPAKEADYATYATEAFIATGDTDIEFDLETTSPTSSELSVFDRILSSAKADG